MAVYKTPGVYVEEISTLPASVAQVETAIPAFIGYTEKASKNGADLKNVPTRISSLVEYRELYGGAPPIKDGAVEVTLNANDGVDEAKITGDTYFLYDSLRLFYDNGGGDCYIISVGDYATKPDVGTDTTHLKGGLGKLAKEDEPTMILFPDAAGLKAGDLVTLQQLALKQCDDLGDRVGVFDLKEEAFAKDPKWDDGVKSFRDGIGINFLKYGAAYTPWLRTAYKKDLSYRHLTLKRDGKTVGLADMTEDAGVVVAIRKVEAAAATAKSLTKAQTALKGANVSIAARYQALVAAVNAQPNQANLDNLINFLADVALAMNAWNNGDADDKFQGESLTAVKETISSKNTTSGADSVADAVKKLIGLHKAGAAVAAPIGAIAAAPGNKYNPLAYAGSPWGMEAVANIPGTDAALLDTGANPTAESHIRAAVENLKKIYGALSEGIAKVRMDTAAFEDTAEKALKGLFSAYQKILEGTVKALNRMPPCGAVAGAYATVDRNRGVWKAPANVSLASVEGVTYPIDNNEQDGLNVDVNAGKSINVIRKFTGKGILIWGARTLAGNDNEWRYVPVRRFYNMVEESIQKSTGWVVFEPNDANTWVRVKAMIENYLTGLWRAGALAGSKPEQAFFVNVGLGSTMTAIDILEGRMIIDVGMAAVRPAEFIILRFMHKLQEA